MSLDDWDKMRIHEGEAVRNWLPDPTIKMTSYADGAVLIGRRSLDARRRIFEGLPVEEDITELFIEGVAIQEAMDDIEDEEDPEYQELEEALNTIVSKIRLNNYRVGKDPNTGLEELS